MSIPARPFYRRPPVIVFGVLIGIELLAWVIDWQTGFRDEVLKVLGAAEVRQSPVVGDLSAWPPKLHVRDPGKSRDHRIPSGIDDGSLRPPPDEEGLMLDPNSVRAPTKPRVFLLGGSAMYGMPYPYRATLAGRLWQRLGSRIEIFNCGSPGNATGELVPVAGMIVDRFQPHTLVIMAGNNEWIRWSMPGQPALPLPLLSLWKAMATSRALAGLQYLILGRSAERRRERREELAPGPSPEGGPGDSADGPESEGDDGYFDHAEIYGYDYALRFPAEDVAPGFDPQGWLQTKREFLDVFEQNIAAMIGHAQQRGVNVILVTVPFNHRLSPAWKHPQPEAFDPDNRDAVRAALESADTRLRDGNATEALATLDDVLKTEPNSPVANYMRGVALSQLKRGPEARQAFATCREHMVGNLGSRLSINERIRQLAKTWRVPLIDAAAAFDRDAAARKAHVGDALIYDDCHPTQRGHTLIGDAVADQLLKLLP